MKEALLEEIRLMGIQINKSNHQDIDGVLWGWCWQWNTPDNHARLTYSFPTSKQVYLDQGYADVQGFQAFNPAQQAAAVKALANYDAVSNLDFVYEPNPAQGNIRFAEATSFNDGHGFAHTLSSAFGFAPDNWNIALYSQGDTWFNNPELNPAGQNYNSPAPGNFAYASGVLHEIGHALGLKHGHDGQPVWDANGNVVYNTPALPTNHDSLEYSIMTYRSYPGDPVTGNIVAVELPSTLMQDDILAIQYLYGANYSHNSGNSTYKWSPTTGEMSVNGNGQGATYHGKIFMTVWDGGGNDTYDFSNYSTNAIIDLAPGAWSTPSQAQRADLNAAGPQLARGCIANAMNWAGPDILRPLIENAIGGRGSDKITGNQLSNKLTGGLGKDTLNGAAGADDFIFKSISESKVGANRDYVQDFTRGSDDIDLKTIDAKSGVAGNNTFKWIGAQGFHKAKGELHYKDLGASCLVQGDVNGDGKADFEILVKAAALGSGDFLL